MCSTSRVCVVQAEGKLFVLDSSACTAHTLYRVDLCMPVSA